MKEESIYLEEKTSFEIRFSIFKELQKSGFSKDLPKLWGGSSNHITGESVHERQDYRVTYFGGG
jgi:hypothetical protein